MAKGTNTCTRATNSWQKKGFWVLISQKTPKARGKMEVERDSLPGPDDQKQSVRSLLQNHNESNMKLGDSFYLISAKWWNDWKEYVQWDDTTEDTNGERVSSIRSPTVDTQDVPSAIDNEDLWEGNEMKPGLMEGENYVIVDEKCWKLLKSWYVLAQF